MVDADSRKGKRNGASRYSFVKAAGASGVAVRLAGCVSTGGGDGDNSDNGSNNGGDNDTSTLISTEETTGDITVKVAGDTWMTDSNDVIVQSMHDTRLPDNTSIDIIAGSQVTDNRQVQYQQWLGGGHEEPTLLMMDGGWTIPFIAHNQLQNLSESLPSKMISAIEDEYFGTSVSMAKGFNGNLRGAPLSPDFPMMRYRKDPPQNAGYTDDDSDARATESMSWEGFSKTTEEAPDANDVQCGYTFQADVYEGLSRCDFSELMIPHGGAFFGSCDSLFGSVGGRPIAVNEQSVLDSIRTVCMLIHGEDDEYAPDSITSDTAPEAVLQWTEEPSRKPFAGDDVIMRRNWSYSVTVNGADGIFSEDLDAMPVPYGAPVDEAKHEGTGSPIVTLGGWYMTMNPNVPQQQRQASAQVLEVMMKPQF